jgi:uncharacterized protein (TIGR02270 family)
LTALSKCIWQVVDQHAEEVVFLWSLRNLAVHQSNYTVSDVEKLDRRVDAHIDGLRIAADYYRDTWRRASTGREPGEVFASAVLAYESVDADRMGQILDVVEGERGLLCGLISAMGWVPYVEIESHAKQLIRSSSTALQQAGVAAFAIHRKDPGEMLDKLIRGGDPLLRARALRAVGELGRVDLVPLIQPELKTEDVDCRFWAAWSASLLAGSAKATHTLLAFAELGGIHSSRSLQAALRRMDLSRAREWITELARKRLRLAIVGAGVIGDPAGVPWLLEQMEVPMLARAAGEAFTMITGVDLAFQDLDAREPNGFESPPNDDPDDDNVEMDQDERLPWPNSGLIAKWWDTHRREYDNGTRYLLGKPIRPAWMWEVLRVGRQRQRTAAALELAIMKPGEPLFEVRAPGFRQQQMLRQRTAR